MSSKSTLISGIAVVAVVGIIAAVVFQFTREPRAAVQAGAPAVPVSVAPVVVKTLPVRLVAIGNVEAYTTVAVKARVDGQIDSVHFKEGDEVKQGRAPVPDRSAAVPGCAFAGASGVAPRPGAARPREGAG